VNLSALCTSSSFDLLLRFRIKSFPVSALLQTQMASGSPQAASAQVAVTGSDSNVVSDARLHKSPLWRHVRPAEKNGTTCGNARSQCLYCNQIIPRSYSRVRTHLLQEEGKLLRSSMAR
jgi:hypothetical protein